MYNIYEQNEQKIYFYESTKTKNVREFLPKVVIPRQFNFCFSFLNLHKMNMLLTSITIEYLYESYIVCYDLCKV